MKLLHKRGTRPNAFLLVLFAAAYVPVVSAGQSNSKPHQDTRQSVDTHKTAAHPTGRQAQSAASKKTVAPVQFIGRDDQTRGDWQKRYGRQAFLLPMQGGAAEFQAAGITLKFVSIAKANTADAHEEEHEGNSILFAWDKTPVSDDVRLPPAANGLTTRQAVTFAGRQALAVRAEASDGKPHQLAVYLLDYQRRGLSVRIEAFDGRNRLVESRQVGKYAQGAYLRYRFLGSILIVARSLSGPTPPLLTGLFVDPAPKS